MPNNYFISGMPKSGKTTLLGKLVERLKARGLKVGGFLSPEDKMHGARTGFRVQDIESGKMVRLAGLDIDGPKVAKYHVDMKSFESTISLLLRNFQKYDIIIIDEIGRMEMKSTKFQDLLEDLLENPMPIIASLHRDYIDDYSAWGEVLFLTPSNRGRVLMDLLRMTEDYSPKPKAAMKQAKWTKPSKKRETRKAKQGKKAKKGKEEKKTKKGKKQGKTKTTGKVKPKKKREDISRIAEDIMSHKPHKEDNEKHAKKEEKKTEKKSEEHEEGAEEKAEEGTEESKEETPQENKPGWRGWVQEHIGV